MVEVTHAKYEEGFDTSAPRHVTLPRARIYARNKAKQKLSTPAQTAWIKRMEMQAKQDEAEPSERSLFKRRESITSAESDLEPPKDSLEYLMLLYSDAERAVPELHTLAAFVQKRVAPVRPSAQPEEAIHKFRQSVREAKGDDGEECRAKVAPLKGLQRAVEKALQKYKRDFSSITDIARMTLICKSFGTMRQALLALSDAPGWKLMPITNRLMPEYDADLQGGYRDMLLNMKCAPTGVEDVDRTRPIGHIAEVQMTVQGEA